MKMTIESTEMITRVAGVNCRIWRGVTERGVRCDLAIPMIRIREGEDQTQFDAELAALPEPSIVVSMRMVW